MAQSVRDFQAGSASGARAFAGFPLQSLLALEAFRGMSAPKLKRLTDRARVTALPRGEELSFQGRDAAFLHALIQGVAKITYVDEFQRPLLVTVHEPGSLFGGRSLLVPRIVDGFCCVALRDCMIASFDAADFVDATLRVPARELPGLMDLMLPSVYDQILRFSTRASFTVCERLAFALVDLAAKFGARDARGTLLTLPVTHDLLAEIVGASRQRVTEDLKELENRGAIKRERRRLILVIPELQNIAAHGLGSTESTSKR